MNAKIYNGNVQPNPKEFKIWVNDEGIIKTWNGTEWIELSGGSGESGGSGSGSGNGVEYTYLDLRGLDIGSTSEFHNMFGFVSFVNYKGSLNGQDVHCVMPYGFMTHANGDISNILALAIDESFMVTNIVNPDSEQKCSTKEMIEMLITTYLYSSLPRITKEEFYNLDA